jgi:hypothetical protein
MLSKPSRKRGDTVQAGMRRRACLPLSDEERKRQLDLHQKE